jgi:hypothetical protein
MLLRLANEFGIVPSTISRRDGGLYAAEASYEGGYGIVRRVFLDGAEVAVKALQLRSGTSATKIQSVRHRSPFIAIAVSHSSLAAPLP